SISNCQPGLRGISFGNFLIKQVVEELRAGFPGIRDFVTLSPLPGFAHWLSSLRESGSLEALFGEADATLLAALDEPDWVNDAARTASVQPPLLRAAARYLLEARTADNRPADPVA